MYELYVHGWGLNRTIVWEPGYYSGWAGQICQESVLRLGTSCVFAQ